VFVLLKDGMDAVGSNREVVSRPENVSNSLCTSAEALAQVENTVFEVVGILCVGLATRGVELWNLAVVAVLFGELLDSSAADLELLSDQGSIHVMINNTLTDLGDIILVKLHFTWWLVRQIMPTKFLAYTTAVRYTLNPGSPFPGISSVHCSIPVSRKW